MNKNTVNILLLIQGKKWERVKESMRFQNYRVLRAKGIREETQIPPSNRIGY